MQFYTLGWILFIRFMNITTALSVLHNLIKLPVLSIGFFKALFVYVWVCLCERKRLIEMPNNIYVLQCFVSFLDDKVNKI